HPDGRSDSATASIGVGFWISSPVGYDLSRGRAGSRLGIPGAHDSALGELAMAFVFGCGWGWYCGHGGRLFCCFATTHEGGWPQYLPWALPMLVFARRPENIQAALFISGALGLVVAAAGCSDFCKREVT